MGDIVQLVRVCLVFAVLGLTGCESGSSSGPDPISFTPGPAPAGQGFVALYAPPVDVGPYPNDIYNPTGLKLEVPTRITSPLAGAKLIYNGPNALLVGLDSKCGFA